MFFTVFKMCRQKMCRFRVNGRPMRHVFHRFQNLPAKNVPFSCEREAYASCFSPFSKSTVFKICRQKMCRFRVNRRPMRHVFHRFQNLPATNVPFSCEREAYASCFSPFSKSTVFKICRQKMCRFRVNGRPMLHIFHRFQNLSASCECSLVQVEADS